MLLCVLNIILDILIFCLILLIIVLVTGMWWPVQALRIKWWKPKLFFTLSFCNRCLTNPQIDTKSLYLIPTFGFNLCAGLSDMFLCVLNMIFDILIFYLILWIIIFVTGMWWPVQALRIKWCKPKLFLTLSFCNRCLTNPQIDIKSLYLIPTFGFNLWTGQSDMFFSIMNTNNCTRI